MIRNKLKVTPIVYLLCLSFAVSFISCVEAGQWISLEKAAKANQNKPPILDRTVTINKDNSQTIIFTYDVFSFLRTPEIIENETYDAIFIEGCGPYHETGKPDIPVKSIFVALPDNALWSLEFLDSESITIENINLLPVQPLPMDSMSETEPVFEKDESIYSSNKMFPANPILLMKVVQLRDEKKFEIRISPIQFNPKKKSMTILKKMRFKMTLNSAALEK